MKTDARYIRNEEKIKDVFKEMVLEMNFENITVKELTDRAKINRKTFYLHYSSIEDLLRSIQGEMTNEYLDIVKNLDIFYDYYEITRQFYLFHEKKGLFCEKLTCDPNYDYIRNKIINNVEINHIGSSILRNLDNDVLNIIMNYINETTISIYRSWVAGSKKIPIDKIIDINYNLVINGFSGIMENTRVKTLVFY